MKSYQFRYTFYDEKGSELGLEWTDDINYPFLSPLKITFQTGKPAGKIAFLTLKYENKDYAFGTIVYSEGAKFVFFSGLRDLAFYDTFSKKQGIMSHITLEKDKKKFHIKLQDDKTQIPIFRPIEIEKDHIYWFSLAMKHPNLLKPLKHLKFESVVPSSAAEKRRKFIFNSFKDITHKILSLPENKLYDDEFVNFDFYISTQPVLNNSNIKLIPPVNMLPRTRKGKIYSLNLLETDYKLGICVTRWKPRNVLENNPARIYTNDKLRELVEKYKDQS